MTLVRFDPAASHIRKAIETLEKAKGEFFSGHGERGGGEVELEDVIDTLRDALSEYEDFKRSHKNES